MGVNYLEIYATESILRNGENKITFKEGPQSKETKKRVKKIKEKLDNKYFEKIVEESSLYRGSVLKMRILPVKTI